MMKMLSGVDLLEKLDKADYRSIIEALEYRLGGLQRAAKEKGVPTAVHYPIPLNLQPALAPNEADTPVADEVAKRVMSLPMHPYLSKDEMERIIGGLKSA